MRPCILNNIEKKFLITTVKYYEDSLTLKINIEPSETFLKQSFFRFIKHELGFPPNVAHPQQTRNSVTGRS